MNYVTTIDEASVPGITAAREAYNASLPTTVREGDTDVANPALLTSDSAYLDFVLQSAIQSWNRQYAAVIVPEVPVTVVGGVPQRVTRRQAKQALILAGLWDTAVAAVEAVPDPVQKALMQTELYDSQTFDRQRPALVQLAKGPLGLTDEQIDALFVTASAL